MSTEIPESSNEWVKAHNNKNERGNITDLGNAGNLPAILGLYHVIIVTFYVFV